MKPITLVDEESNLERPKEAGPPQETEYSLKTTAAELFKKPAALIESERPVIVEFGLNGITSCRIITRRVLISGDARILAPTHQELLCVAQGVETEDSVQLIGAATGELTMHKLQIGANGSLDDIGFRDK